MEPVHALEFHTEPRALTASEEQPNQHDSRPCSPSGDECPLVPASFATAQIPPDLLDHDYDEVDSLQEDELRSVRDYGYHSSASSTGHSSDVFARDLEDEKLLRGPSRTSSHSSVSSIPPSALVHSSDALKSPITAGAYHQTRHRDGTFRRLSSVRAIQIHSDDESNEYETSSRYRGGQHYLDISMHSAGSPPMKQLPYYPPCGSAGKQKIRREYPLVLLHCNLLPPSLPVVGFIGVSNQNVLKEVLPTKYYRRWKLLEEKVGSGLLRDRGVLISHPEDTYDLLEERLLESLELQQPRLHHGHFLRQYDYDSNKDEGATDDEQGEVCLDCGGRVITCNDRNRKWEIKVFAANGLMRAGAWATAWKEMEKVDVEVGLWLPADVRRELERKLLEDKDCKLSSQSSKPHNEVAQETGLASTEERPRSVSMEHEPTAKDTPIFPAPGSTACHEQASSKLHNKKSSEDIDLQTLMINYIRVLASDRRNIAIVILSIFVAFLAVSSARIRSPSDVRPFPQVSDFASVSVTSMPQHLSSAIAGTSSVLNSIPTPVADKSEVASVKELHTSNSSEMPIPSGESLSAPDATETELQNSPADVDDADHIVSSEVSEVFDQPGTVLQKASPGIDGRTEELSPTVSHTEPGKDVGIEMIDAHVISGVDRTRRIWGRHGREVPRDCLNY